MSAHPLNCIRQRLRRIFRDSKAVAYVEFAVTFPAIMAVGMYGLEAANLAMTHMKISQIALSMADNSSRIGQDTTLSFVQFRELDANDTFAAAKVQAGRLKLTERGRIILSSLEQNAVGGQWIHWQRCIGLRQFTSPFGAEGTGLTGTAFAGMGALGNELKAPVGNAVMFVEIQYQYEPLFSDRLLGPQTLYYTGAFLVRDKRDLTKIYNLDVGVTASTCNRFTL